MNLTILMMITIESMMTMADHDSTISVVASYHYSAGFPLLKEKTEHGWAIAPSPELQPEK